MIQPVALPAIILAALAAVSATGANPVYLQAFPGTEAVSCLLFLDPAMFLCMPCLDGVLRFAREVPGGEGRSVIWGIVLHGEPPRGTDIGKYRLGLARRARSALRASGLDCPIAVDDAARWRACTSGGTGLLVLDGRSSLVRAFRLPLEPSAEELIKSLLRGRSKA